MPLLEIRLAVIEHDDFLSQRKKRARKLLEALGEFPEILLLRLELLRIGGGWLIGQCLALLNRCPESISERRAQLVCRVAGVGGFLADFVELVHGAHVVI